MQHEYRTILAERSVRLREIHRLSQRGAAALLGISGATLSRIEQGKLQNVTWRVLGSFCLTFDVTPNYLLGFDRDRMLLGFCPKCHSPLANEAHTAGHTIRDCILSLEGQGRRTALIAVQFDLTVSSIEFIIREEYRIRGNRASLVAAKLSRVIAASGKG